MTKSTEGLSSVYNAIRILREYMNEGKEIGISELGTRLGLAKSTIYRLVKTLREHQLVQKNEETDKYYLGVAAFELGFVVYHSMEIRMIAFSLLDKLMHSLNKVARLGVYSNGGVVFLCSRVPEGLNYHYSKIGSRTPASDGRFGQAERDRSESFKSSSKRLKRCQVTSDCMFTNEKIVDLDTKIIK